MRLTQQAHAQILDCVARPTYSLDATCGSGYDTVFLQSITQTNVWSFDVQLEALDHAKALAAQQTNACQTQWVHDGHQHLDRYVDQPLDVVMFNFGYWPKGNHQVTTLAHNSIIAVTKALNKLSPKGVMTLLLYPGHIQGKSETRQIQAWIQTLPQDRWSSKVWISQPATLDTPLLWVIQAKGVDL